MTADETHYDDRVFRRRVTNEQIAEQKLTVREAALLIGVGHMTIYRLLHSGELGCYRITRGSHTSFRIPVSAVREFLAKSQSNGGAE